VNRYIILLLLLFRSIYAEDPFEVWTQGYDALLKMHVSSGSAHGIESALVDYKSLRKDAGLRHLMRDLAYLPSPSTLPEKAQLALWINAYNCICLKLVADHPEICSINDLDGLMRTIWSKKIAIVAHKKYSLNDIEHGIIRKVFNEPRALFALCAATLSAPDLSQEAYVAERLDGQLDLALQRFASNPTKGVKLSQDTLTISPLFQWYAVDFPPNPPEWLMQHRVIPLMHIAQENMKTAGGEYRFLRYFEYNWLLNAKYDK